MSKQNSKITIDSLFKNFDYESYWTNWDKEHSNELKESDWGKPVGKEVL